MKWNGHPKMLRICIKTKGNRIICWENIPLIVFSKGKGNYSGLPDSTELEKKRLELQNELAHLSTNGKHIIDKNSGHNIHLEDPATVIAAIEEVLQAYKTHAKLK